MFNITILPNEYNLITIDKNSSFVEPFLKIIFCKDFTIMDELLDFHISQHEISIIVPHRYKDLFKQCGSTGTYTAIRVDTDNPGLEEAGIIANLTSVIKTYNITILAISTFKCNYIFIPSVEMHVFHKMISEQSVFTVI